MQTPKDSKTKENLPVYGVKPKYMSMGSWKADASKGGSKHTRSSGNPGKT